MRGACGVVAPGRAALLALVLALAGSAAAFEVPYLSGRVVDEAGMIPEESAARIAAKLEAFERETGAQVVVVTVPDLAGEPLEEVSLQIAETWKIGRGGVDDGVVFLLARDDRKMRLEVGYGLEGRLTDAACGRILDDVVRPRLRAGDFGGGIEAGVDAVLGTARGQVEAIQQLAAPQPEAADLPGWPARLGIFAFFLFVVGIFSLIALSTPGGQGWFLYAFLIPFWSTFPVVLLGKVGVGLAGLWVLGTPVAKLALAHTAAGRGWQKRMARSFGGSSGGGGWSTGGGGGWSSGGGGGGFSGGGGSFGGGGSSSSW